MQLIPDVDKEELYDVVAALRAAIRELTEEIVELQGNICYYMEELCG